MLTRKRHRSDGGIAKVDAAHIIPETSNKNIGREGERVGVCDIYLLPTQETIIAIRFWGCLDDLVNVYRCQYRRDVSGQTNPSA